MHNLLRCTLALACVYAMPALGQESTSASTSTAPRAGTNQASSETSDEAARVQAVKDYWTPDRLASAIPMPVPRVAPEDVNPSAAPLSVEPLHVGGGGLPSYRDTTTTESSSERFPLSQGVDVSADATPAPLGFNYEMPFNNFRAGNRNTYPYSAIGKLFFVVPPGNSEAPGNYVCSAAVAIKTYIVVTARHCVFDIGSKKFYTNWVFYPGWNNGSDSALHGAWIPSGIVTWVSASTLSITTGWDIAMMDMHDSTGTGCGGDTGRTIGSYTGWLGYSYGGDYSQRQWNIFGYPQGSPFEGNYLYQDNGATGAVNPLGSTNIVEAGNPQTGGTSGGPWVIGFDPGNATDPNPINNTNPTSKNLANGVNSFIWTKPAEPLALNGTIFQASNFWNLYTFLSSQPCK
jgi:V8-like Glu-specific endopeptidase